ncbi:hypothetical protein O0L34_g12938 [Tuta absoluta]|nr:hypothetical protein O0L34_g12938 [Tuta absoluta]
MVQCTKCKQFLPTTKPDDIVKCKSCGAAFHKKCVSKKFLKNETCDECAKQSSPKITLDQNKATAETVLAKVNQKLEILYELQEKNDNLAESVDFYAAQYQQLTEFKHKAEKQIKALENENTNLLKCNRALEERVSYLEIKEKEKNIEIVGINWKKDEDVVGTVKTIASFLGLDSESISEVKKVGAENTTGEPKVDGDKHGAAVGQPRPRPRPRSLIVTLLHEPLATNGSPRKRNV